MDKETWLATAHGVSKSQTRLSDYTTTTTKLKQQNFIFHVNESWKPVSGEASLPGLQAVHNNGFWKS